ncbi:unnamed protein product, partial [Laminaria digitata]
QAIHVLVDAGADVNYRSDANNTPLHLACYCLRPGSVEALLRRDAKWKLRNGINELP